MQQHQQPHDYDLTTQQYYQPLESNNQLTTTYRMFIKAPKGSCVNTICFRCKKIIIIVVFCKEKQQQQQQLLLLVTCKKSFTRDPIEPIICQPNYALNYLVMNRLSCCCCSCCYWHCFCERCPLNWTNCKPICNCNCKCDSSCNCIPFKI